MSGFRLGGICTLTTLHQTHDSEAQQKECCCAGGNDNETLAVFASSSHLRFLAAARAVTALLIEFGISGFGREGDAVPAAACGCLAGCAMFLILLGLTGCRQAVCSGFRIRLGCSSAAGIDFLLQIR